MNHADASSRRLCVQVKLAARNGLPVLVARATRPVLLGEALLFEYSSAVHSDLETPLTQDDERRMEAEDAGERIASGNEPWQALSQRRHRGRSLASSRLQPVTDRVETRGSSLGNVYLQLGSDTLTRGGKGLFATHELPRGTVVARISPLSATVKPSAIAAQLLSGWHLPEDATVHYGENCILDSRLDLRLEQATSWWYSMNHATDGSPRCNVQMRAVRQKGHLLTMEWVTIRAVRADEELRYAYGDPLPEWEEAEDENESQQAGAMEWVTTS